METQIFHHATNIIFKKKNPPRYYNSIITNLKFQHKPKISTFKNPHIKIDLLLLPPRGQNPLSYFILYSESKHNILALVGKANKVGIHVIWKKTTNTSMYACTTYECGNVIL
jgi:hypothetical protein